jgi:hypothetical protein
MDKKLTGIIVGATLLVGGGVPMVPREAPFMYAYQYQVGSYVPSQDIVTATGTIRMVNDQPQFADKDGDGYVSVKVSFNKKGGKVYEQTDETTYRNMGKKYGAVYNTPVKYTSSLAEMALEAMIPNAEAAIALDSAPGSIPNCSPCTSLTWAHTVTGTNPALVVSGHTGIYATNPITGITYAGNAMTSVGAQATGVNQWVVLYQITGTTGTNNIVISSSPSIALLGGAVSYTGVDQSSPVDVHGGSSLTSTNVVQSLTTSVDNAWLVGAITANRALTPTASSTYRDSCCGNGLYDTNGPQTPAGSYSVGATQSDTTVSAIYALALKPAAAGVAIIPGSGCFANLRGNFYCKQ